MQLQPNKRLYFVSDAHFGLPNHHESLRREKLMVQWLNEIRPTAHAVFLVGDIFDFWWEYRRVVPQGYTRLLGTLAEMADSGIEIHFFWGNHDLWMRHHYLVRELGAHVHPGILRFEANGRRFFVTHGDGLGPGDKSYKLLKILFHSRLAQWLFSGMHPDWAMALGNAWSSHRKYEQLGANQFYGRREFLYLFSQEILKNEHFDYLIFGHRHTPVVLPITDTSQYINTGDWLQHFSYAEFDGEQVHLRSYEAAFAPGQFPRPAAIRPAP